jgi:hypothetical protein
MQYQVVHVEHISVSTSLYVLLTMNDYILRLVLAHDYILHVIY